MMIEITMPAAGPAMEAAAVARWLVRPHDKVAAGDPIAEIETDKAIIELEASTDGTIAQILVEEGSQEVPVGTLLALLSAANVEPVAPAVPPPAVAERSPAPAGERVRATPLARRIARTHGIDLARIRGTGPGARIVRADLAFREPAIAAMVQQEVQPVMAGDADMPLRAAAVAAAGRFQLTIDCKVGAALSLIYQLNESPRAHEWPPLIDVLLIKALALAIRASRAWAERGVNIAIMGPSRAGAVVLRGADTMGLFALSRAIRELHETNAVGVAGETTGADAEIVLIGRQGIREFTAAAAHAPCTLSIGSIAPRPLLSEGVWREEMLLTAVAGFESDGFDPDTAADLLLAFGQLVEAPLAILA